jgi:hypothetical protein
MASVQASKQASKQARKPVADRQVWRSNKAEGVPEQKKIDTRGFKQRRRRAQNCCGLREGGICGKIIKRHFTLTYVTLSL